MQKFLDFVENNLLWLAIATAVLGLLVPPIGFVLEAGISPLLAALMFVISLTFDAHAVTVVFRKPSRQIWALALVYGPMSIAAWLTGRLFFGSGNLASGQTLVGTLPTDVSAPLLVLLAKGNVALAAVLNAVNTGLSPFIVPFLFLALTGIELQVPVGTVVLELVLVVLIPTLAGVYLRTRFPRGVGRYDNLYPSLGSILYLLLLLAVIGPNAENDHRLRLVCGGDRGRRFVAEHHRLCGWLDRPRVHLRSRRVNRLPVHHEQEGVLHRGGVRGEFGASERDRGARRLLRRDPDDHLTDRSKAASGRERSAFDVNAS